MSAIDVFASQIGFLGGGLLTEQGVPPPQPAPPKDDGGEAIWGAAFRQTNVIVSAIWYLRNSGAYKPVPGYNPIDDIMSWGKTNDYFLNHGTSFVGSQSPAETQAIKARIDQEEADKRILAASGMIGFIAQMGAGMLDPTILLPGGVGLSARGGMSFTRAPQPSDI
ncbi:hypothetical protein [Bradyrhizobium diazoefficiens]|uniref:hypothetical protein n=1 Tax=Bradyrhizobium diazoefficiens TaxID=1355477 RepID=UPI001B74A74C|nr:hypothetical protein [Bradyrhizobium japonicum]